MIAAACLALFLPAPGGPEGGWRDVVPAAGEAFEHPPFRAILLGDDRPDDVVERAIYRGTRRRYAQLRYGSPNSVRVAVVVDEGAPGGADLYVDADRNRRIEDRDRVAPGPDGKTRRVALPLAIVQGEATRYEPRVVLLRPGSTGLTLGLATAGYREGVVRVEGKAHAARRVDGDGDGAYADPRDRVWIDLDDDGRWDPSAEQFPFSPILKIGGARLAARSDPLGDRLELAPLEGVGTIRLAMSTKAGRVAEVRATLVGRDGSAIVIDGQAEATVPAGEYRLASVVLGVDDPGGGPRWSFVFADGGRKGEPTWHAVAKNGATAIDPIGRLELSTGLDADLAAKAGGSIDLQPRLTTGDGLLIVTVGRASPAEGPTASIALTSGDGTRLATARSGFA